MSCKYLNRTQLRKIVKQFANEHANCEFTEDGDVVVTLQDQLAVIYTDYFFDDVEIGSDDIIAKVYVEKWHRRNTWSYEVKHVYQYFSEEGVLIRLQEAYDTFIAEYNRMIEATLIDEINNI